MSFFDSPKRSENPKDSVSLAEICKTKLSQKRLSSRDGSAIRKFTNETKKPTRNAVTKSLIGTYDKPPLWDKLDSLKSVKHDTTINIEAK
jgi:hypothetical protein